MYALEKSDGMFFELLKKFLDKRWFKVQPESRPFEPDTGNSVEGSD